MPSRWFRWYTPMPSPRRRPRAFALWCASGLGLAFGVACGQWVAAELGLGFLATVAVQVTLGLPVMGASYAALGSMQVLLATHLGTRPMLPDESEE